MIDLYIFDEGGVLIRNHMIMGDVADALGLDMATFLEFIAQDIKPLSRGSIDSAEFWRRFSDRTGIKPSENYLKTLFRPLPDEDTFSLVDELSKKARVVCGTNTIDSHHEINLKLGLYSPFHAVYASHIIGHIKPEPEFWQHILEEEGVSAQRTFFTDDSEDNIQAASSLGIQAVRYIDADHLRRTLFELGAPIDAPLSCAVMKPRHDDRIRRE
ncbi:MAG: Alpha-D-glucose-1-phosphate phosphatase YihX [Spirochaetes bacterium ADurb.Bin110]|jgi:putative hydrolase of the HAD superfamily|nr:MAG: Alpha-D-glucose-1-phosphate phosphatase YihX [Spirochaetes bacterium ADurb.Bin110]